MHECASPEEQAQIVGARGEWSVKKCEVGLRRPVPNILIFNGIQERRIADNRIEARIFALKDFWKLDFPMEWRE